MYTTQLTAIFCQIDDFCKEYSSLTSNKFLSDKMETHRKKPGVKLQLVDSEIMTILVWFQSSGFRTFKIFYNFIQEHYRKFFPKLVSYSRFVELTSTVMHKLAVFSALNPGKRTGIYFIDSTCLPVCHIRRATRHRTFDDIAAYGHTSVAWFFGFKFHLVVNDRGELMAFKFTPGNVNDAKAGEGLLSRLQGLAFGDKGYLGKELCARLLQKGLKLITKTRKNMRKIERSAFEKQLLKQRGIIETIINHFKHHYHIWHTRHRSIFNAFTHLLAGIAAYVIEPLKISAIKLLAANNKQICLAD